MYIHAARIQSHKKHAHTITCTRIQTYIHANIITPIKHAHIYNHTQGGAGQGGAGQGEAGQGEAGQGDARQDQESQAKPSQSNPVQSGPSPANPSANPKHGNQKDNQKSDYAATAVVRHPESSRRHYQTLTSCLRLSKLACGSEIFPQILASCWLIPMLWSGSSETPPPPPPAYPRLPLFCKPPSFLRPPSFLHAPSLQSRTNTNT